MGYLVRPSGRLRLPAVDENAAVRAVTAASGAAEPAGTLADVAWIGIAALTRKGDWIEFGPDDQGDPKWSDEATEFYVAIAPFVREGTVRFEGEDGAEWSYSYADGRIKQAGWNGWDASIEPFGEPTTPE